MLPAARGIVARTSRLQSRSYLFCVIPHGFSSTRSLPGGVRDEQKGLGFTGREGRKISLLSFLPVVTDTYCYFSYFPPPPSLYEQIKSERKWPLSIPLVGRHVVDQ